MYESLATTDAAQVDPVEDQRQVTGGQLRQIAPLETSLHQSLGPDGPASAIPRQDLDLVATTIEEHEPVSAGRIKIHGVAGQAHQSVEALAHVGGIPAQEHAHGRRQGQHEPRISRSSDADIPDPTRTTYPPGVEISATMLPMLDCAPSRGRIDPISTKDCGSPLVDGAGVAIASASSLWRQRRKLSMRTPWRQQNEARLSCAEAEDHSNTNCSASGRESQRLPICRSSARGVDQTLATNACDYEMWFTKGLPCGPASVISFGPHCTTSHFSCT